MANGIWLRNRSGRKEVWIVHRDETGTKRRQKIGIDSPQTRIDAKEVLAKLRHQAVIYKHFPERNALDTTFREAAQKYMDLVLYKATKSWQWRWKQLVEEFGDARLVDLKADRVQAWYNKEVARSKVGAGNANRSLSLLGSIFRGAIKWDLYALANPVEKIMRRSDPPPLSRFLSKPEMVHFFTVCHPDILPIVVFSLLTGVRRNEALNFRWENVDLERRTIRVVRLKRGKFPEIPVAEKLHKLLEFLGPKSHGKIFEISPMTFRRRFEEAVKASKLEPFTWRDFRRTFSSFFAMATQDLQVLSRLLGHTSLAMVSSTYVHLLDGHVRSKMGAFDAAMPELPGALRGCVPVEVGHHLGHQAISAEVAK